MKQTNYAPSMVPTAVIAVNKSRLKIYKNVDSLPTYYLTKGTTFSIELANPTKDIVLAKIIINGKAISQGGLVLKPGQRIWLERYLDVAKKFTFDTYEVSSSKEMKAAIENNGNIRIEFYKEKQPIKNISFLLNGSATINLSDKFINNRTTTRAIGYHHNNYDFSNGLIGGVFSSNVNDTSNGLTLDYLDISKSEPIKSSKTIETGRIEHGPNSNQEITYVNKSFEDNSFHIIEYKLLPMSQKINTIEDINVKVYCTSCGHKLGKTDRFCSSCGTKR